MKKITILLLSILSINAFSFQKINEIDAKTGITRLVNIPLTVDEAELFAKKHHFEFMLQTLEKGSSGSSSCAHTPACIIVISFIIYDSLKEKEHYKNVRFLKQDKVIFEAEYSSVEGKLQVAEIKEGALKGRYHIMTLPELEKTYLLNINNLPDFLPLYKEKYKRLQHEHDKASLLMEYFSLHFEPSDFMMEVLESDLYSVELKSRLSVAICSRSSGFPKETQKSYLAYIEKNATPEIQHSLFSCLKTTNHHGIIGKKSIEQVITQLCSSDISTLNKKNKKLTQLYELSTGKRLVERGFFGRAALSKQTWVKQVIADASCQSKAWKLLFDIIAEKNIESKRLVNDSAVSKRFQWFILHYLNLEQRLAKALVFSQLQQKDASPLQITKWLHKQDFTYKNQAYLMQLLESYYKDNYKEEKRILSRKDLDNQKRAYLIKIFSMVDKKITMQPFVKKLDQFTKNSAADYIPYYFFNEKKYLKTILKGLEHRYSLYNTDYMTASDIGFEKSLLFKDEEPLLIFFALSKYGFSSDEITVMHKKVRDAAGFTAKKENEEENYQDNAFLNKMKSKASALKDEFDAQEKNYFNSDLLNKMKSKASELKNEFNDSTH